MPNPHKSDLIELEVWLRDQTDKAWAFSNPSARRHSNWVWVPKSVAEFEEVGPNGKGTLTLPEWLARERDLI